MIGIIEAIVLIIFIFYRFGKKTGIVCAAVLLIGAGLSFVRPSFNKSEYKCLVVESKDNYYIASSSLEKFYVSNQDNSFEIGDIVTIKGIKKPLDFKVIESGFDFKKYLNNKGVYSELVADKTTTIFSNPIKIQFLKQNFLSNFNEETKSVVALILFGDNIDSETTGMFRDLQLIRLISNSGMFLHLIFSGILFLISYLFKDKWSILISILLFCLYGIFTFPRFVVIKFILLQIIKWINKYLLKNKFTYLELVSMLGIGCLIFDYHLAYQDSFLLAFLIPIFVLFYNGSFKKIKKIKKKILLSFFIFILFIPFSLNYNNGISILSLPFQIILLPFTACYGVMSFLAFFKIPLYSAINGYTAFLKNVLNSLSHIFIKIYAPPFNTAQSLLFELSFIVTVYFISIKFKDIYRVLIPVNCFAFAVYLTPIKRLIYPTVAFINVGQGDSCLITYKNYSILIDTGGSKYKDYATDCLIPYFEKRQLYKINYLITTHNDIDHNGAVDSLISNFKVENYITNINDFPLKIDNLTITNLNTYTSIWEEDNDKSLVLYFKLYNYSFLVTGDAPKKIEKKIVQDYPNLHTDILKAGHHGSNTSSCEEFIKSIKPKEAVISCGKNNMYGHPHKDTIAILKKYNVIIRRTDIEGSVIYRCN